MHRFIVTTGSAVLLLAGIAAANAASTSVKTDDAGAVVQNSNAMSAADEVQHMNMRQQIEGQLSKAGYTDVSVTPSSFYIRAKDKAGNQVAMVIGPDTLTEVTDVTAKNASNGTMAPNTSTAQDAPKATQQ